MSSKSSVWYSRGSASVRSSPQLVVSCCLRHGYGPLDVEGDRALLTSTVRCRTDRQTQQIKNTIETLPYHDTLYIKVPSHKTSATSPQKVPHSDLIRDPPGASPLCAAPHSSSSTTTSITNDTEHPLHTGLSWLSQATTRTKSAPSTAKS